MSRLVGIMLWGLLAAAPAQARGQENCDQLLPDRADVVAQPRIITARDLIELRDIGPVDPTDARDRILAVSPDGRRIAFQVRQAQLSTNSYCFGMVVLPLDGSAQPRLVDKGGEYIRQVQASGELAEDMPPGDALVSVPKWSPDGRWIAYLRRDGQFTQLWRAASDGIESEPMTSVGYDVESFAWAPAGDGLVISGRPDLAAAKVRIAAEGLSGYRYDDRFKPNYSKAPLVPEPVGVAYSYISVKDRGVRPATPSESALLSEISADDFPGGWMVTLQASGQAAWLSRSDPSNRDSPIDLHVKLKSGEPKIAFQPTQQVTGLWWAPDGRSVFYMTTDGWGQSWDSADQAIYQWTPEAGGPRKVLATEDVLIGCELYGLKLICGHESAEQPRTLVSVDLVAGTISELYDLNPQFHSIELGTVQRLRYSNRFGLQSFADLVLPPGDDGESKLPLVVVQYRSRGFLRGGTGDEYPIQLFAAHGFAVLSVNRPMDFGDYLAATGKQPPHKTSLALEDRQSVASSLDAALTMAEGTGRIDKSRIGLSGFSDGSRTAQFAAIHNREFAAFAISHCCFEPSVSNYLGGPALARAAAASGIPDIAHADDSLWRAVSFGTNSKCVQAPILIQIGDGEYLGSLEGYMALEAAGKAVEMYVYPDETHYKWQPAHRMAVYSRSLAWFSYWLQGDSASSEVSKDEFGQWLMLRARPNGFVQSVGRAASFARQCADGGS